MHRVTLRYPPDRCLNTTTSQYPLSPPPSLQPASGLWLLHRGPLWWPLGRCRCAQLPAVACFLLASACLPLHCLLHRLAVLPLALSQTVTLALLIAPRTDTNMRLLPPGARRWNASPAGRMVPGTMAALLIFPISTLAYAWTLHYHVHLAAPLIARCAAPALVFE